MIDITVIAEFTADSRSPDWVDGESFTYRGFLPAVPSVDTEISGIKDYDHRTYTVKVHRVEMTVDSAMVCVYGVVV